jgi:4'-phosphopantetheinyl transferase
MSNSSWRTAPSNYLLPDNEVHVWRADLRPPADGLTAYAAILSDDERQRAGRFHFAQHRDRFIVARGILRCLLGAYLQQAPEGLRFVYGPQGKPALEPSGDLRFNLAHSHELALYAFTHQREIGVDVEYTARKAATVQVAERFFAAEEVAAFRSVTAAHQRQAFFNGWTRKEAFLKARGEGITVSLSSFAVSLVPDQPAQLLWVQDEPREAARWRLAVVEPGPEYQGALCVEGTDWRLCCWDWGG